VHFFVETVKEYRFVLVLRGEGLERGLTETDLQQLGVPPLPVKALMPGVEWTVQLFNRLTDKQGTRRPIRLAC
jgi:2,3-bisphosphoglycerate-independent phosphoglycerate mutase